MGPEVAGVDAATYWCLGNVKSGGRPVVYVAHPVGAATVAGVAANMERAYRWLAWLLASDSDTAFCMSWLPYCTVLEEDGGPNRLRGLRDNLTMVGRCDAIVLVGGRVSSGMDQERAEAVRMGLRVHDWTWFGEEPPALGRAMGARP